MTTKQKHTGHKAASTASKLLSNPKTPAAVKRVAASDLSQAPPHKKAKKKTK
jgi:hypothetical protein